MAPDPQEVVEDVQEPRHLTEDEDLAAFTKQSWEEVIEHLELHRHINDVVAIDEGWTWLYVVEEVGVVADLLQLHQDIEQLNAVFGAHAVHSRNVSSDDLLV